MMPEEYDVCDDCGVELPLSDLIDGLCSDCRRALDDVDTGDGDDTDVE